MHCWLPRPTEQISSSLFYCGETQRNIAVAAFAQLRESSWTTLVPVSEFTRAEPSLSNCRRRTCFLVSWLFTRQANSSLVNNLMIASFLVWVKPGSSNQLQHCLVQQILFKKVKNLLLAGEKHKLGIESQNGRGWGHRIKNELMLQLNLINFLDSVLNWFHTFYKIISGFYEMTNTWK